MAADIRESSLRLQNALQVLNNHNQELQQFLNAIPNIERVADIALEVRWV
jgi:hypothetical protein